MIQIKENPPLFVYFLIQFSDWKVKAAEDFHMLNSFPFKNKIIVGKYIVPAHSVFAFSFSFPKDESNQQWTYIYLFVFCFKMRKKPLHFPTYFFFFLWFHLICSLSVPCAWLPTVCALKRPDYIKYSCCLQPPFAVAVCRHNHYQRCHRNQLVLTAIVRIGNLLLLPPLCSSWDIQVKVPFTKARPWATLPPRLEAYFCAWRICAWLQILGVIWISVI